MCCCCDDKKKEKRCLKPENLKDRPEDCAPEQIQECHGDDKEHPCTDEKKSDTR